MEIKVPWIPSESDFEQYQPVLCNFNFDNEPLPAGNYRTGFTSGFTFSYQGESIQIEEKSFNINFTVSEK